MVNKNKMRLFFGLLLFSLFLVMMGCAGSASQGAPQVVYPTVVVVQYVTQVVATNTPEPPVTPLPPCNLVPQGGSGGSPFIIENSSGAYEPLAVMASYPLTGCPVASRLQKGFRAFVSYTDGIQGIYQSADFRYAPIFRKLQVGEVLEVVDGPVCSDGALLWRVIAQDGVAGFVPEGDGNTYWMLPYGEKNDRARTRPTPEPVIMINANNPNYNCAP
jgi:hypothetical protein